MHRYRVYYKDNLLIEFVNDPRSPQILGIDMHGIHHFNGATEELYMSCPAEDVQVERDGVPVTLHTSHSWTVADIVSSAYKCIEKARVLRFDEEIEPDEEVRDDEHLSD